MRAEAGSRAGGVGMMRTARMAAARALGKAGSPASADVFEDASAWLAEPLWAELEESTHTHLEFLF